MSYFSDHYPLYVPPSISGYEELTISITNQTTMTETGPLTKGRYNFALSSFARIYGVPRITQEMSDFCLGWALHDDIAPLDCLHHVDKYFRDLWIESQN
ncbi:hypothetical protein Np200912_112 [Synechococcus phage S-RIM2]|uniref:Uncharacterized protein n=1 Tax=Synechococcus phage S-RIM2 TaxID=687800 RepID=A0A1D7RM97_9CAUD|nr:hypothetical protein Np200912_112 [Synechococcus phage S-RIM2]